MASSGARRNWTRGETLVAFRLYCRTPFGKLHQGNPEIVELGRRLGRTASAVGMKACNFASLDPAQRERGIRALANVSALDEAVWAEFEANPEAVAAEAEGAYEALVGVAEGAVEDGRADDAAVDLPRGEAWWEEVAAVAAASAAPGGETEVERVVRARRVQGFFRAAVLTSYGRRCALSGLAVPALLNASHIVPWAASVERRADPRNGLCLNALLDRAFDRGLITFDEGLAVVVSPRLARHDGAEGAIIPGGGLAGRRLTLPERFEPDAAALAYHRERVFQA